MTYQIADFCRYRQEKPLPMVDITGEKKLARTLFQWTKDLHGTIRLLEQSKSLIVAKGLVKDLKHLWNELDSEIMEFWCQVAEMDPYHLRRTFVIKVKNLIESRPDLKPLLRSLLE